MVSKISVSIGMTGKELVKENNLEESIRVDRQPAGINFYEYDWPLDDRGTISFVHGEYGFEVNDVIGLMCPESAGGKEGFSDISISFGVAGGGEVPHKVVKEDFYSFIEKLVDLGWKPWNQHDLPRLKGEEAFSYLLEGGTYIAPLDYRPSLEEWMALKSPSWELYADGVHLGIRFRRDRKRMDPESSGAYLFTASLETADQRLKSYIAPEDRDDWRDLIDDRLENLTKRRAEKEAQLQDRGFTIDISYEDPAIDLKEH